MILKIQLNREGKPAAKILHDFGRTVSLSEVVNLYALGKPSLRFVFCDENPDVADAYHVIAGLGRCLNSNWGGHCKGPFLLSEDVHALRAVIMTNF